MKPYSVEIFRPDFTMVGNTNVNEVTYKEDYLTDENTITVLALPNVQKQDFIRISRGGEEYAGVVTEIGYGTDRSKRLQTISYKPLVELLNTSILFDVDLQNTGTLEEFICDCIRETFITETASVLTDLAGDEDVNYNNTAYDLELATFGVTRTGITNLVPTFEKITGASGSGGASTLQWSTEYFKGDFVTCKTAPGWVTLYCTTAGVTAAAEPVEYAGIAEVGDRVTDGTCVFTARDVVGEIDVSSTSTYSADLIAPSNAKPIVLSIIPHHTGNKAKLYLAQFLDSGNDNNIPKEYSFADKFLAFGAEFAGDEDSLKVEPPFTTIKKETSTSSYYYCPTFDPTQYVPYVVSKMVAGVETYYCAIGSKYNTYGNSTPGALTWVDGSTEASLISTSISVDSSLFRNQRFSYLEKNQGEIVSVTATTSSNRTYTIYSSPADLFAVNSRSYSGTITARGSICPLNVVGEAKLLATFDVNSFPWASITEAKVGSIKPNLPMPSSAKVFVDAAAYLWGKGIFLIFVGTGIIFSRTLEAGSFGYLDTTSVLGTITQFGWLGYSQDEQSLYILGQDTSNRVKLAKFTLNTNFDYATNGAWLPMIVSDGIPAYIKAKTTE